MLALLRDICTSKTWQTGKACLSHVELISSMNGVHSPQRERGYRILGEWKDVGGQQDAAQRRCILGPICDTHLEEGGEHETCGACIVQALICRTFCASVPETEFTAIERLSALYEKIISRNHFVLRRTLAGVV